MNREELIKKWLDNNLNTEELKAFEQLEDYKELMQLNGVLKSFKSPQFSVDNNYENLKSRLKQNTKSPNSWLKPLLKVAAVVAICFSVYFYTTTLNTVVSTQIAQSTQVKLPDASTVDLNSNSTVSFNKNKWDNNRKVELKGEAFFKVAKGQKFDVVTKEGIVSVLGTQFNVKERDNYFKVTCYEGLVAVKYNEITYELPPGNTFKLIDGKLLANEKEFTTQPSWLRGESNYTGIALKHVLSDLKNQYDIKITIDKIDTSRLFSGSFTHKNLDLALQSITIPLNLSYSKSGNSIVIKRD